MLRTKDCRFVLYQQHASLPQHSLPRALRRAPPPHLSSHLPTRCAQASLAPRSHLAPMCRQCHASSLRRSPRQHPASARHAQRRILPPLAPHTHLPCLWFHPSHGHCFCQPTSSSSPQEGRFCAAAGTGGAGGCGGAHNWVSSRRRCRSAAEAVVAWSPGHASAAACPVWDGQLHRWRRA